MENGSKPVRKVVVPEEFSTMMKQISTNNYSVYDLAQQYSIFGSDGYTKEDIIDAIKNEDKETLREFSSFLYLSNAYYRMPIMNMVGGSKYHHVTVPVISDDVDEMTVLDNYTKVEPYIRGIMNKKYLSEMFYTWLVYGGYYGYERKAGKQHYLQHLNPNYCRLGSQIINGLPTVEFNFDYFEDENDERFELFDAEFKTLYRQVSNETEKWAQLNPKNTIVVEATGGMPILSGAFASFLDEDSSVALCIDSMGVDNMKMIMLELPVDEETGEVLADLKIAKTFVDKIKDSVDESISVVMTPYPVKFNSFEENKMSTASDKRGYLKERMMESGLSSSALFGNTNSKTGYETYYHMLENIINMFLNDLAYVFELKLNLITSKKVPYKVEFLGTTVWNQEKQYQYAKEMMTYGGSVTLPAVITTGMDISTYTNLLKFEKMTKVKDYLVPPQSANTQSSSDSANDTEVTTDEGETSNDRGGE